MSGKWMPVVLSTLIIIILAGCGQSKEELIDRGINRAEEVFKENPKAEETTKYNQVEFYLPSGFTIEKDSDETNIILTKSENSYVLFINPNEKQSSKLFYDLMKQDPKKTIVKESTFEKDGQFGFVAVSEHGEKEFEIVVSIGGIKMTTVSKKSEIDENIEQMMEIVHSVKKIDK